MSSTTPPNQMPFRFGLNFTRCHKPDRQGGVGPASLDELVHLSGDDAPDVILADVGLAHPCRIDVHLEDWLSPRQHVFLKGGRNVHHEAVRSRIEARVDLIF